MTNPNTAIKGFIESALKEVMLIETRPGSFDSECKLKAASLLQQAIERLD